MVGEIFHEKKGRRSSILQSLTNGFCGVGIQCFNI
jgi:hypothetical protein